MTAFNSKTWLFTTILIGPNFPFYPKFTFLDPADKRIFLDWIYHLEEWFKFFQRINVLTNGRRCRGLGVMSSSAFMSLLAPPLVCSGVAEIEMGELM